MKLGCQTSALESIDVAFWSAAPETHGVDKRSDSPYRDSSIQTYARPVTRFVFTSKDEQLMRESFSEAFKLIYGFAGFQALNACIELGVFELLDSDPDLESETIAGRLGLRNVQFRSLLCMACSFGLLSKTGERYKNSELTSSYFTRSAPRSLVAFVDSARDLQYRGFSRVADAVRTGTNAGLREYDERSMTLYEVMTRDGKLDATLYDVMARIWDFSADGLKRVPELEAACSVLDVAGGSGYVADLLTETYPGLSVTVFDRPSTCEKVREAARAAGKEDRIAAVAGDITLDPLPKGADAVMFCHCLEWLSPDEIVGLLRRAHDALAPGGAVLCYQFAVNDDETGGLYSARLSMYFNVVETGQGYAYPAAELERFFAAAGFSDVRAQPGPFEHVLIVGRKLT